MSPLSIYYVADSVNQSIYDVINSTYNKHGLRCIPIQYPELLDFSDNFADHPSIFLINSSVNISFGQISASQEDTSLSARIHAEFPNHPVVMITRSPLNELTSHARRNAELQIQVDELISVVELIEAIPKTLNHLLSLSEGFLTLRSYTELSWGTLLDAIRANQDEADNLFQAFAHVNKVKWTVRTACDWIKNTLIGYPGILYDSVHSATLLGISLDSFHSDPIQRLLEQAQYKGVFGQTGPFWWKRQLIKVAEDLASTAGMHGPLNQVFIEACQRITGTSLSPAICIWDCTPLADEVCYLLNKPVKLQNSLNYLPDNRPTVMDRPRVSFRAIIEDSRFQEELLNSRDLEKIKAIHKLDDPCQ